VGSNARCPNNLHTRSVEEKVSVKRGLFWYSLGPIVSGNFPYDGANIVNFSEEVFVKYSHGAGRLSPRMGRRVKKEVARARRI